MKISNFNFFSFKTLSACMSSFYLFKLYKEKTIKCHSDEEEIFESKEDFNLFDETDKELSEDDDFMKAMQDPTISEEEKIMLKKHMKQQSIQPLPFSKLSAPFKHGIEEEKWNGIRGIFDWTPNQMAKIEYSLTLDSIKSFKNYKISTMTLIPFSERSQNGLFLIGRKEGDQSLALQCHLNLNENNKILIVSSHPKPDVNQGHYVMEYTREWERLTSSVKVSNMETSVSAVAALYKNIFVGFEAVKHPQTPTFLYNYGICLKPSPQNKLGFAFTYLSVYPAISLDILFQATKEWSSYVTISKNWHPMAAMQEGSSEFKMTHVYNKKDKYDFNFEVDYHGLLHFYHTHYITKNLGLQLNLEFNPFAKYSSKNKKVFRSFGVGFKFSTPPIEEEIFNITNEETYEEYEFDRISKENIK